MKNDNQELGLTPGTRRMLAGREKRVHAAEPRRSVSERAEEWTPTMPEDIQRQRFVREMAAQLKDPPRERFTRNNKLKVAE